MKRRARRVITVAIGATIAIIAVVAPAVAVSATSSSPCSATAGVTVIVDFTHFAGGKIERGCAPGHPTSALAVLRAAGFTTAGTTQYGNAFLCRVDGLPSPNDDACLVTPSATAYWAFWRARPSDASWTYSNVGVLDYRPPAGTIEAFAFGNHAQPGISPAAALPTPPTTRATAPPTARPTTSTIPPSTRTTPITAAPTVAAATITTAPTATNAPAVTLATATSAAPTSTPGSSPRSTPASALVIPTSTSTTLRVVDRSASGPVPHDGSGSPRGAIVAIVVVGSLAIGALAFTRARRHRAA